MNPLIMKIENLLKSKNYLFFFGIIYFQKVILFFLMFIIFINIKITDMLVYQHNLYL